MSENTLKIRFFSFALNKTGASLSPATTKLLHISPIAMILYLPNYKTTDI